MSPTSGIPVFGSPARAARLVGAFVLALGSVLTGALLLGGSPAEAATHHVVIKQYAYSPAALSITAGDSVTWTNEDSVAHDVHVTSGPATFASPMLSQGQSWTFRFTTAGSYSYLCSVHPDMTARVTVAPAPVAHPATVHHTAGVTRAVVTPAARKPVSSAITTHRATTRPAVSAPTTQTVAAAPAASVATPSTSTTSLDPLLIVAGFSTAVVVFCLLLMTARPEPALQIAGTRTPAPDGGAHAAADTMVDHRAIAAGD